jgi:peptide/nickel transport system substrate-binding protein
MAYLRIMPKQYYNAVGKDGFAAKPIGSGPYDLVEFRANDIAVLKKKTTAHPFRNALPTQLTFRAVPDQGQLVNGFKTGDLDVLIGQITNDRIAELTKNDAVVQYRLTTAAVALFSQPENQLRQTPLTNRTVRLALNYAVDKTALAKLAFGDYAKPSGQIAVPSSPAWDDAVQPIPYDPAMAKKLLADAGYPNGFTLPVGIDFTPFSADATWVQVIQSNLRDVGVTTPVNSYEFAAFLDRFYSRNGQSKGDIFIYNTTDGNGFATSTYGGYTCNKPPAAIYWCNPEFDKNMEAAVGEADIAKRGALMRKAYSVFRDDVSHLFLFSTPNFIFLSPKIKGFVWQSDNFYDYDSVYRVD